MKTIKITAKKIVKNLPERKKDSHKRHYGTVLVVAGSNGMAGAAILSARAALKAGAGLVTLAIVKSQQPAVIKALPEAMTIALDENPLGTVNAKSADKILKWQKKNKADVMLIGPGLGLNKDTSAFVKKLLSKTNAPFILDADGLNSVAKIPNYHKLFTRKIPSVITPHAGEALRLLNNSPLDKDTILLPLDKGGEGGFKKYPTTLLKAPSHAPLDKGGLRGDCSDLKQRIKQIQILQKLTKGTVVLKGHQTLISDGDKIFVNPTGGPALAKGGSGDILAGLIAGFWAQIGRQNGFDFKSSLLSAITAVYLHGLSADLAVKELTQRCVLASELLNYLPNAIKKVKSGK